MNRDYIEIVFPALPITETKAVLPTGKIPSQIVTKISKETLSESLSTLIEDIEDIISKSKFDNETALLESIEICAQISANGGFQWVGNIGAGVSNSVSLHFKIVKRKT